MDAFTSLAFSIYSNKGVFALLLGSGISRASGIPTGWEVMSDLVTKIAAVEGHDCGSDPVEWFRVNKKSEPDYSKLLHAVAKTSAERQQLLKSYFEPTEDERSAGLKIPSAAHKAIARLVQSGYIRVILTTNFDRLIEKALDEIGISPTVISTDDQILGSLPLVHSKVTLIKIHGDYLDTRIRNTESELNSYEKTWDSLLDRIFDEYGLIVSGWSGDWDLALRSAIERCSSRRFTTFWAVRSALSERSEILAVHRRAQIIQCKDADAFFSAIEEKVRSLDELKAPHPLSVKIAIATVKRYLVDSTAKIRLYDLVFEETTKLLNQIRDPAFQASSGRLPHEELVRRTEKYKSLSDLLLSIVVTGVYWGESMHNQFWVSAIQRIAERDSTNGQDYLVRLKYYPVLLLMYGAGISAVASGNSASLVATLTEVKILRNYSTEVALCSVVYPMAVIQKDYGQMMPGLENRYTPTNDILHGVLREYFREYLPRDMDYDRAFDRFEYYLGMIHADLNQKSRGGNILWGPVGRFAWKEEDGEPEERISMIVDREINEMGAEWFLIKAGLFGGSLERVRSSKAGYDALLQSLNWY